MTNNDDTAADGDKPRIHRLAFRVYLIALAPIIATSLVVGMIDLLAYGDPVTLPPLAPHLIATLAADRDAPAARHKQRAALLKRYVDFDVTVYDKDDRLLVSNVSPTPAPLPANTHRRLATAEKAFLFGAPPRYVIPHRKRGKLVAYGLVAGISLVPEIRYILLPTGLLLLFLAISALFFARSLARPITRLTDAATAFGQGDLNARAHLDQRKDELGQLGRAYDEMADQITHLLRAQKELLANVSHELRTPLARIRVALDIAELEHGSDEDDGSATTLAGIADDLSELERLVGDILITARLDLAEHHAGKGTLPLRLRATPAREIIDAACRGFATYDSHPLEVTIEDDLPSINADPVMLRRVIDNLLDNARKYSAKGSVIRLNARAAALGLLVEITDRGIGIDEADLARLFTPFFRADQSRARATGGVGLGLSLSRQVVEAHGGSITIESKKGEGTIARFSIPAMER